jgi:circadian clock protein KaiC
MSLIQAEKKPTTREVERTKTGIPGLEELTHGGFPKHSITLVSGPPGSGKTIICCQFLYQGAQDGDKCLFLTLDKKVDSVLTQARTFGMDFQPYIEQGQVKFLHLNINKKLVYETMTNEILSGDFNRIVLDSITPLSEMPIYISSPETKQDFSIIDSDDLNVQGGFPVRRLHLHFIMNALDTAQCTSMVTSELPSGSNNLSRDGLSEFLADSVIVLSLDPTMDRRKLSIMKMRNTKHTLKPQDIEFGSNGIRII